ncbi:DUF461 domain-containing protein [Streptomyces sp. Amel2xC10]|uniref:DUF461 domain-containing protein n=1 Tax=Streptomyces sp. Amel2xC10 TaxID=1305826 RepID=UPI000A08AA89|nr:DUF461 domain-containing protein [Streptomyces sp. Amel2xC10]SMF68581.1 hypothetical protein SAMN02745830_05273 [Streptomyces sp. Amel2xC10]
MSSSLRRGALAASALAFSIATLAACGAGNNSQTLEIKPDNAATSVGVIKVQNAVVITQPAPEGSGPVAVSATVFNGGDTDQTVESIEVEGLGTAKLTPAKGEGKVTVPAFGSLVIGGDGNASAVLESPGEDSLGGNAQKTTFTFSETGAVTLRAFVVPAESYFSSWGPSDIPSAPQPKPSESAPAGSTESPAAGESAEASPSDTASAPAAGAEAGTEGTEEGTGH